MKRIDLSNRLIKDKMLLLAFFASSCLAQTIVYTTGTNGEISAYIIANGTTSSTNPSSTSAVSGSATVTPSTTETFSTITKSTPALPTTPYTGQSMLTGTCSIPVYTALQYADGHFIEVPLIGCSDDRPECCPSLAAAASPASATDSDQNGASNTTATSGSLTPTGVIASLSQAPLSVCPSDMVDIDPVCCPSGFTKWGQAILGNTPCASLLSTSYPVPTSVIDSITSNVAATLTQGTGAASTPAAASASVTVIVNQVFALGLPCADNEEQDHHGLSTGAKAGIGVGVALGVIIIVLLIGWACLLAKRHRKRRAEARPQMATTSPGQPMQSAYPLPSKEGAIISTEHMNQAPQTTGYPAQDPGYGQGFVDGIKAAMSPYQSPPQSPPPLYGGQRSSASYAPVEVPAQSTRQDRPADRMAELSGSDTATRSSAVY